MLARRSSRVAVSPLTMWFTPSLYSLFSVDSMWRMLAPLMSLLALSSSPGSMPSARNFPITEDVVSMASTTFFSVQDMNAVSAAASLSTLDDV